MNPSPLCPTVVSGVYYAPDMATSQTGLYTVLPMPSYGMDYFIPTSLPTTTTIPYPDQGFISPTSYSVPFTVPSLAAVTQSQTEEVSQMLGNITFSSPPTSPQVTDDNQQPIISVDVAKCQ